MYEIVCTTVNGLHRIRLGDVIKVTGYFNSVPKYILIDRYINISNLSNMSE